MAGHIFIYTYVRFLLNNNKSRTFSQQFTQTMGERLFKASNKQTLKNVKCKINLQFKGIWVSKLILPIIKPRPRKNCTCSASHSYKAKTILRTLDPGSCFWARQATVHGLKRICHLFFVWTVLFIHFLIVEKIFCDT